MLVVVLDGAIMRGGSTLEVSSSSSSESDVSSLVELDASVSDDSDWEVEVLVVVELL